MWYLQRPTDVAEGVFAAYMDVQLHNDGPVTVILDSGETDATTTHITEEKDDAA